MTTNVQTKRARNAESKPTNSARTANPIKKAQLSTMLARPKGATIAQIEKALGWQSHTIRAAISGLRKTGAEIVLDKSGKTPTYKAQAAAE